MWGRGVRQGDCGPCAYRDHRRCPGARRQPQEACSGLLLALLERFAHRPVDVEVAQSEAVRMKIFHGHAI